MSRHEGVSCDSCIKGNFRGLRFKCLICYDYDLCAACYEAGATNTRHTADHPMQCILTRSDYDTFYGGESISSDTPQSYTCPYCGKLGFCETALYDHVASDHTETPYEVVCPICASLPGGEPNQVTDDFAAHLTMEHRSGGSGVVGPHTGASLREEDVGGVGRGVSRRIPHPTRGSSGPRSRRPNMHFTSSGSGLSSSSNTTSNATANGGGTSSSTRDREREAMDPIAELLSQLSGVRRGLSGVSGASGLGSVLGLGALGSLGGALGSLGANLGGPSAGSNSGLPVSSGRSAGRLLGLVGRDNSGAFSEVATSNGTSTVTSGTSSAGTQPQLERHQALRLPRRQTQVLSSAPSTFTSSNVSNGGVAGPSAASATVTSAPVTGLSTSSVPNNAAVAATAEAAGHPQLLLSRLGNVLKERRESNSATWSQERSLFIQDLMLSTLALGFNAEARDWTSTSPVLATTSSTTCPSPVRDSPPGRGSSGSTNNENPAESSTTVTSKSTGAPQLTHSTATSTSISTRPKQTPLHEPKGSVSSSLTGRRNTQQQSGVRVSSASSTSSTSSSSSSSPSSSSSALSTSSRVPLQGSGTTMRSRSSMNSGASGTSGSNASNLPRKPNRPQTSHPPPPPSSH